jgi:chromosomal replication initiation ATPase DnaA
VKIPPQIPLDLGHSPSFEMADFIVSGSNEAACGLVRSWPNWPSHIVALVGPKVSGKTHLAEAWAAEANAVIFHADMQVSDLSPGTAILADDLETQGRSDEEIFHLFNWVKEISATLLITARTHPTRWGVQLPDLRSRLATITVGEIQEPDDELLMMLMAKLFSDRQLQVDLPVLSYVIPRIERSFAAIHSFVARIDSVALADKRRITRALAKSCLEMAPEE